LAKSGLTLKPVLTWKTRIQQIKKIPPGYRVGYGKMSLNRSALAVAILPVGYADGYPRSLSNRAEVLVRGKRAPVIGSVCMDLTMVEVSGIPGVKVGDKVTLIGRDGRGEIRAEEMSAWAGTIPYEIFTSISGRVSRVYSG
jgi:alanine racemase